MQVVRWGNSHAVRLPKQILEEARIAEGEELLVRAEKRGILLEPITPELTLAKLVAAIDPELLGRAAPRRTRRTGDCQLRLL